MAKVTVSKAARNDLLQIRAYLIDELLNLDAAQRIIRMLRQNIEKLTDMPERGKQLDTVLGVHTGYRFLACENYRIFYLFDGETVEIVRVLHTLQDFMRALFF